jgi:superoxide dismutase
MSRSLPYSYEHPAIRNNGGGHANHTIFWWVMSPNVGADRPRRK